MNGFYQPYWGSSYLEHHGILGMKWGVRRYQNKDGSLTIAGRERYGFRNKLSKVEAATINGQSYSKDITFPTGTVGYRVQSTGDIQANRPLYLSFNKDDHIRYLAVAGDPSYGISVDSLGFNADQNAYDWANKNIYSVELKAKEPIKAPSYQHAMEIFVEMVGDIGIEKLNPYDLMSRNGNDFIESWKNRNIGNLGAVSAYTKFVDTMRKPDRSSFYEDFLNRLEKKGYNALVDPEDRLYTADKGYSYGYNAPFIIMDPTKVLEVSKKTKLSNEDIHYISRNYDLDFGDINKRDEYMSKNPERYSEKDKAMHEKWKKWFNE